MQGRDVSDVKIQRSADADVIFTYFEDADANADTSFYKIADADVIFIRTADADVENNADDPWMRMQMQIFDTSLHGSRYVKLSPSSCPSTK